MSNLSDPILWIVFATLLVGILVLIGMALLYLRSYPSINGEIGYFIRYFDHLLRPPTSGDYIYLVNRGATLYSEIVADVLAKKEAFWSLLIQSAVSVVVVVFVVILLLLKIVTAEAGLPILAAFGGAAISRGVSSARAGVRTSAEPSPRAEGETD